MTKNSKASVKHKAPPIQITEADVFIIESMQFVDEEDSLFEGRIVFDILRMCGKNPKYYYFRTEAELVVLADKFRQSGYRYLHLSCHGNPDEISTTLGPIPISRFAEIFESKLRNRRLFISACEIGNEAAVNAITDRNRGMYSIASPAKKINFDHAVAIWAAFYVRVFDIKASAMKSSEVAETLRYVCRLFGAPIFWSWYKASADRWEHETLA